MLIKNIKNSDKTIQGPAVAVDTILFSIIDNKLCALLLQIKSGPYENKWAIPGGLVQLEESLEDAAKRLLFKKANIKNIHMEQLYTFGDPKRDSRGRSISVAYFSLIEDAKKYKPKFADFYKEIKWHPVKKLPKMAFDHKKILSYAHRRLKNKMEYSNIAYALLPQEFTLTELQKIYEIIWNKKLDKRNFRKKMLSSDILEKTNNVKSGTAHRPAQMYKFKTRELTLL